MDNTEEENRKMLKFLRAAAQMAEALDCCSEWLHDEHGDCDGSCAEEEDGMPCLQCQVLGAIAEYKEAL
jgi:hypothetical protein